MGRRAGLSLRRSARRRRVTPATLSLNFFIQPPGQRFRSGSWQTRGPVNLPEVQCLAIVCFFRRGRDIMNAGQRDRPDPAGSPSKTPPPFYVIGTYARSPERLSDAIGQGYDLVCGWRMDRPEGVVRRWPSRIANVMLKHVVDLPIHDFGTTFR